MLVVYSDLEIENWRGMDKRYNFEVAGGAGHVILGTSIPRH